MNKSTEALIWAMNARGLSQAGWRVLVTLARRVGKRGFDVWPKHKTLAEDCEMGVSTVRRALAELEGDEAAGRPAYIKIIPRFDQEGDRTSNIYRLQVHATLVYPAGEDVEIRPDDEDDDASIPSREEVEGGLFKSSTPPAKSGGRVRSNRADGLLASGQAELDSGEHIPEEDSPSPDGEAPPGSDLFAGSLVEFEIPQLEDLVVAEWHKLKEDFPGVADVGVLNDSRRKKIRARAAEVVRERKKTAGWICTEEDVWREIFERIRGSTFLTGRDPPGKGYTRPFKLDIDFVLRPSEFLRILDRDNDTATGHHSFSDGDGRRYGPAEEATRAALASLDAPGRRRAG